MSRAGISSDHAERCLGHVISGVRGVYDRHEYLEEKRQGFEALAGLVERIVNPQANIVSIARRQAMKPELKQGVGIWLSFQLAAEEVERRLGLSWGAAQKTLIEACENEEVRTRGSDVFDIDFWQWLNRQLTQSAGGKQSRMAPDRRRFQIHPVSTVA
jgi:hypothetical protein